MNITINNNVVYGNCWSDKTEIKYKKDKMWFYYDPDRETALLTFLIILELR